MLLTGSHSELKTSLRIDGHDAAFSGQVSKPDQQPVILPVYFFRPTMSHRIARFLMFWFFIALQAMTPFIHAHAGAVHLKHANFLHLHQGGHGDAAYHALAADEHGAEVEVAQGMPLRNELPDAAGAAPLILRLALLCTDGMQQPGTGLPAPPALHLALPAHTLPHALAPPFA